MVEDVILIRETVVWVSLQTCRSGLGQSVSEKVLRDGEARSRSTADRFYQLSSSNFQHRGPAGLLNAPLSKLMDHLGEREAKIPQERRKETWPTKGEKYIPPKSEATKEMKTMAVLIKIRLLWTQTSKNRSRSPKRGKRIDVKGSWPSSRKQQERKIKPLQKWKSHQKKQEETLQNAAGAKGFCAVIQIKKYWEH